MKPSKTARNTGWILAGLVALFMIGPSAIGKFIEWEGKEQMMDHLGYSIDLIKIIGVVEIVVAVLILIPRTAFVGTVLLTAYLGGATATHVRVGDPFVFPIIIAAVAWIALGLRMPDVFRLALGNDLDASDSDLADT